MSKRPDDRWQVQDAKQKFSELVRATEAEGTQFVTRHGADVVAVVPIQEFRRLIGTDEDFVGHLLNFPTVGDDAAAVFDEIEAARKADLPREIDFGTGE